MYRKEVVMIPEKVKYNTRKSGVYVYLILNQSYSPEKKYSTDSRILIGKKIDDKTMYPNENYFKYFSVEKKEEIKLEQKEFSDTLSVGDTSLIQSISENIKLRECLERVYGEKEKI